LLLLDNLTGFFFFNWVYLFSNAMLCLQITNLEKVDGWEFLGDLLHQLQHCLTIIFATKEHHRHPCQFMHKGLLSSSKKKKKKTCPIRTNTHSRSIAAKAFVLDLPGEVTKCLKRSLLETNTKLEPNLRSWVSSPRCFLSWTCASNKARPTSSSVGLSLFNISKSWIEASHLPS